MFVSTAPASLDVLQLDPTTLGTEQLEDGFAAIQRLADVVEGKRLVWLQELERRKPWRRDGVVSGVAWLADRFGLAAGAARQQMRVATELREMPAVQRALKDGEVSPSAVRVLASARHEHPEAFTAQEDALLDQAQSTGVDELTRALGAWSQSVDGDDPALAERLRERRQLAVCPTPTGMVSLRGELDPESGESVVTALRSIVDSQVRSAGPDARTSGQRWADALTELALRHLDRPDRPFVGGERPHVTVTVDMEALGQGGGLGRFDHAGRVSPHATRRLACDASIRRVVMSGDSQPLDIGRRSPIVPPALRQAVVVRDRTCRFPGCDRPNEWCDAHHVVHWADGGRTSLDNLVLMCRPHHRMVHEGGFGLRVVEGRPVFRRPDGSILEDDRSPPCMGR